MEDVLTEILELCLSIDKKACRIYKKLSDAASEQSLKDFWRQMAEDEKGHIAFWERLHELASMNMVPQIFDNPYKTREELEHYVTQIDFLEKEFGEESSIQDSFYLAYRLEFYMLHPTFERLFHFVKKVTGEKTPEDDYEIHIDKLIDQIETHGFASKEMEFLGETLHRLWRENRALTTLIHMDSLTKVYNRKGLFDAIIPLSHLAQRNHFPVGVMMVDIDRFKLVNDTYGHQTGDEVLEIVARTLKENVRASDIVGRYGGEEFLLFFSPVDMDSLKKVAHELHDKVEAECCKNIPVTISIGVAYGYIEKDVEEELYSLISRADTNLYQAKETGRNKVMMG